MRAKTLTEYSHSYQLPRYPCPTLYLGAFWIGLSVSNATCVHLPSPILPIFSCHVCQSENHLAPRDFLLWVPTMWTCGLSYGGWAVLAKPCSPFSKFRFRVVELSWADYPLYPLSTSGTDPVCSASGPGLVRSGQLGLQSGTTYSVHGLI